LAGFFINRNTIKSCIIGDSLPPKKPKVPNKFWDFIIKLRNYIFSRKFLDSSITIFITGYLGRYILLTVYDVNVFTDIDNNTSLGFYASMSFHISLVKFEAESLQPYHMMEAR